MSQMISLQPLPHAPPGWNKYDEHLLRNKIFPRNKYGWFLLTNPSQRERNCSAQLVGGRSTLSLQSEGASSQVIDAGNGQLWWLRWSWQWLKMFFSSSVQSADPNHPLLIWKRVPGRRLRRHSEQANGSKGGDASQDLRPLCLQELEEGAYRHGELNHVATPSLQCIVSLEGRGRLCRQLLLMPGRRLCPLEATSATWLEVRGWALRAAGGDEQVVVQLSSSFLWRRMQWWDVNEHDREDEGFSAEMQKGKLMFAQAAVFNPQWEVFLFAPPCPRSCLHSRDQVQVSVKFSCNDGGDQSRWCLQWWCQRW